MVMLLCFAAAWPCSLYKSYKSRSNKGKSLLYMVIVLVGYCCGAVYKFTNNHDFVTWFYIFNGTLVIADLGLYVRNKKWENTCSSTS